MGKKRRPWTNGKRKKATKETQRKRLKKEGPLAHTHNTRQDEATKYG